MPQEEGILVGISSGTALTAAVKVAAKGESQSKHYPQLRLTISVHMAVQRLHERLMD